MHVFRISQKHSGRCIVKTYLLSISAMAILGCVHQADAQTTIFDGSNTFTKTNNFFQDSGANVQRINDRVLFGGATVNDANSTDTHIDWLSQDLNNFGVPTGSEAPFASQLIVLNTPWNSTSHITTTFGAESVAQVSAAGISGLDSYCHNNNVTYANSCWAAYFDAKKMTSASGAVYAMEGDPGSLVRHPHQTRTSKETLLDYSWPAEVNIRRVANMMPPPLFKSNPIPLNSSRELCFQAVQ